MPWHPDIIDRLEWAKLCGETHPTAYYDVYNRLLMDLFPLEEDYVVHPFYQNQSAPRALDPSTLSFEHIDLACTYAIGHLQNPVFFIQIKPGGYISDDSSRQVADFHMREWFKYFTWDTPVETMYGISAIGTKLCIYTLNKAARILFPKPIRGRKKLAIGMAPKDRWDLDILTPEGEQRLREVVAHVKEMCPRPTPEVCKPRIQILLESVY
jgi:hypothetical protein